MKIQNFKIEKFHLIEFSSKCDSASSRDHKKIDFKFFGAILINLRSISCSKNLFEIQIGPDFHQIGSLIGFCYQFGYHSGTKISLRNQI